MADLKTILVSSSITAAASALIFLIAKPKDTITVIKETVVNHVDGRVDQVNNTLKTAIEEIKRSSDVFRQALTSPETTYSVRSNCIDLIKENDAKCKSLAEQALATIADLLKTGNQTEEDDKK